MCSSSTMTGHGRVFGASLLELFQKSGTDVPFIVADILRWLATKGLTCADIFQHPSKTETLGELRSSYDAAAAIAFRPSPLDHVSDPCTVTTLLLTWLAELPEPILPFHLQVDMLTACSAGDIGSRILGLQAAAAKVESVPLGTLKPLLLFLQQYCFRQKRFEQQLRQVSSAFTAMLFPAAFKAGPNESILAENTTAILVSNALHIFNPMVAADVPLVTPISKATAGHELLFTSCPPQRSLDITLATVEDEEDAWAITTSTPFESDGPFECLLSQIDATPAPFLPSAALSTSASSHEIHTGLDTDEHPCNQDPEFISCLNALVSVSITDCLFGNSDSDWEGDDMSAPGPAPHYFADVDAHVHATRDQATKGSLATQLIGYEAHETVVCVVSAHRPSHHRISSDGQDTAKASDVKYAHATVDDVMKEHASFIAAAQSDSKATPDSCSGPVRRRSADGGACTDQAQQPRRRMASRGTADSAPTTASQGVTHIAQSPRSSPSKTQHVDLANLASPTSSSSIPPSPMPSGHMLGRVGGSLVLMNGQRMQLWAIPGSFQPNIREMIVGDAVEEKELMKKQLRAVASAFEQHCGRPMATQDKEVLRPLYVRYHRLKSWIQKVEQRVAQMQAAAAGSSIAAVV